MATNWIALLGKTVVIALCAAVAAWGYIHLLVAFDGSASGTLDSETSGLALMFALVGCFAIGLPIALLIYVFSAQHLARSVTTLAMVAVLCGVMLVLASFVVGGEAGAILIGVPAFIAAITFAVLGWFWILRPMRGGVDR